MQQNLPTTGSDMSLDLPLEFDDAHYSSYDDLAELSETQRISHYTTYGRNEGRRCSLISSRNDFLNIIPKADKLLEIGPYLAPCLSRPTYNVQYFDVLSREGMIDRAKAAISLGHPDSQFYASRIAHAAEIDFVHPTGDLSAVSGSFDSVFSSHCVEHQVDLIKHINQISDLLRHGGRYYLIVPDKRYCFDYYHPLSRTIDVIAANLENRQIHTKEKVLEHRFNVTHNDPARHWAGDHGQRLIDTPYFDEHPGLYEAVLAEAKNEAGIYIDVHNWIFTPDSFREISQELYERNIIKLRPARVWSTLWNWMEFYAVFEKP